MQVRNSLARLDLPAVHDRSKDVGIWTEYPACIRHDELDSAFVPTRPGDDRMRREAFRVPVLVVKLRECCESMWFL